MNSGRRKREAKQQWEKQQGTKKLSLIKKLALLFFS